MDKYEDRKILTKEERFCNILYFLFRYLLYASGFYALGNIFNEFIVLILMCIFIYLSMSYDSNKKKIQQEIIVKERRDVFRKAKEIDSEDEIDIF